MKHDASIPDYRDLATRNLDRAVKAEQREAVAIAESTGYLREIDGLVARLAALDSVDRESRELHEARQGRDDALALASRERQTRAARDETISAMERREASRAARVAALVAELYAAKRERDGARLALRVHAEERDALVANQVASYVRERDEARESHAHLVREAERQRDGLLKIVRMARLEPDLPMESVIYQSTVREPAESAPREPEDEGVT